MATLYADRAFISINGAALADVQSASLKQNHNAKPVPSMTRDKFNKGFVRGNVDIDISLQLATQNTLARPKIEAIPFDQADVALNFQVGADLFTATGLFIKDNEDNAGGIGDEVKATFTLGALKVVDAVGNSVLFNFQL